jgi:aconitate decarboxylase
VEVILKNRKALRKTVDNFLGSYQRPMTDEQMAAKFRRLASKTLSTENVKELEGMVRNLEGAPSVANLVKVLQGEKPHA